MTTAHDDIHTQTHTILTETYNNTHKITHNETYDKINTNTDAYSLKRTKWHAHKHECTQ